MENNLDALDLSGKRLKKLNKPTPTEAHISVLILDDNELQRLDNIDSFTKVQKLSVVRNQLLRMYGICRLHALHTLNLAHNGILTIEGLKELIHLKYLCLAGNNIKTIEHLHTNINVEHLDLSENSISHISDLSFLKNLKELLLNGNRIGHLRQCERYLPTSLVTLTLASNNLTDLNEISQLVQLSNLTNFSIASNPCVTMTGNNIGFDYRPFIINWCMNIKVIDGYVVDAIESLRAEWLYSQGRGRHFRLGDHTELTQYLASVCPLSGETLETEEDRKLRLILSKAQHHQQQLREQLTTNGIVESNSPSPAAKRRLNSNKNSPRLNSSRLSGGRPKSPDRMATSCYGASVNMDNGSIMSQSLDPKILSQSVVAKINNFANEEPIVAVHEHCLNEIVDIHSPLKAATKLVPVPESLMSPDYRPSNSLVTRLATPHQPNNIYTTTTTSTAVSRHHLQKKELTGSPKLARNVHTARPRSAVEPKFNAPSPLRLRKNPPLQQPITAPQEQPSANNATIPKFSTSSEDESEMCAAKLQTIRSIAQERSTKRHSEIDVINERVKNENAAAVMIQKMWRGYQTRNLNKKTLQILKTIQAHRTEEHIHKLAMDMESTKAALESERKIQMLQMQAINALWKKVSTIQTPNAKPEVLNSNSDVENSEVVKDLAQTCSMLNAQVQQLQSSMQDVMRCMSIFCQMPAVSQSTVISKEIGTATQTEIVAVHTPQGEAGKAFPFQKTPRPSSLPLPVSQRVKQNGSQTNAPQELKQFAGILVDGVIKTVAETSIEAQTTEITVTDTDKLIKDISSEPEETVDICDNI
ncbi:Centrosomal protein 97kDa [Carabus blaptoides fortunei]